MRDYVRDKCEAGKKGLNCLGIDWEKKKTGETEK